jgi:hypothetical protein
MVPIEYLWSSFASRVTHEANSHPGAIVFLYIVLPSSSRKEIHRLNVVKKMLNTGRGNARELDHEMCGFILVPASQKTSGYLARDNSIKRSRPCTLQVLSAQTFLPMICHCRLGQYKRQGLCQGSGVYINPPLQRLPHNIITIVSIDNKHPNNQISTSPSFNFNTI